MDRYGEILLLGPCRLKCFYCLGREMKKAAKISCLGKHFTEWPNFNVFIQTLLDEGIDKVYISSVNTDPLLYGYISELIDFLNTKFKYVGIRINAAMLNITKYSLLDKLTEEISISLNSNRIGRSLRIAGPAAGQEWWNLCEYLDTKPGEKHTIRLSIVVNRHNEDCIPEILGFIRDKYSKQVQYVQLRKVYKYKDKRHTKEDWEAFENTKQWLEDNSSSQDGFYESRVFSFGGLKVSLWEDVFSPNSVKSLNYFPTGLISRNHLLVPAFENEEISD